MDERERNKAVVRRFIKEIFEELRTASVDELVADDFVWHSMGGGGDKQFLREATTRMRSVLADIRFVIEDEICERDRVAVRLTTSATARSAMPGVPNATGHRYEIEEIHIFKVRDGRVIEHWHQYDAMSQQRQLSGEGAD